VKCCTRNVTPVRVQGDRGHKGDQGVPGLPGQPGRDGPQVWLMSLCEKILFL